jgi:hypothetical protein
MSLVICKLPRAGIGNQLFPLLKAHTFAHFNNLPVLVVGYHQFKIGPHLRNEKVKRNYNKFFIFEKNIFFALADFLRINISYKKKIVEPAVIELENHRKNNLFFIFSVIPHWDDYFHDLRVHRELVLNIFYKLISPGILKNISNMDNPCIGVHIRMGDFRKMRSDEDFSKLGAVRTPELYFIEMIKKIREINGAPLPVSVFTDGYKDEFECLFDLENINIIEGNKDIEDLLLLSRSKLIITSAGSTFSYWSAFLSTAAVILHPDDRTSKIRSDNSAFYEGTLDVKNKILINTIKEITL